MHYYHKEIIIGGFVSFIEALKFSSMMADSCKIETPFIVKMYSSEEIILCRGKILIILSYEIFEEQRVEPYYNTFISELSKKSNYIYYNLREFQKYNMKNKPSFEMTSTVNHMKTLHTTCKVNGLKYEIIEKFHETFECSVFQKDKLNKKDIELLEKGNIKSNEMYVCMIYPGISTESKFYSYMGLRTFIYGPKISFENLLFIETEDNKSLLEKIHESVFYYKNENKNINIFISKSKLKKQIKRDEKKYEIIKNRISNSFVPL